MSVSPPPAPPGTSSPSNTAGAALGVTGGASVFLWFLQCLHQGALVMPDTATAMIITAAFAPIAHALYNALLARINRLAGVATTVTFAPTKPGEPQ